MTHPFLEPRDGFRGRWALVKRGGGRAEARPLCRMAWLISKLRDGTGFRGQVMGTACENPTKHAVTIEARDVVCSWSEKPSLKAIRNAKLTLKPIERYRGG